MTDLNNLKHNSANTTTKRISIVGVVGLPANYGGFETLVENLVKNHAMTKQLSKLTVYCSSKAYTSRPATYLTANLRYLNLKANGITSVLYDFVSLVDSAIKKSDTILLLGVSGALALPIIRILSNAKIITNVDGIEWKRAKWGKIASLFLKVSEWAAVRFSHIVIADNVAIANYLRETYGRTSDVIAYGGDHAISSKSTVINNISLPKNYYLGLCRIEPENNVSMILGAFSNKHDRNIVFVGNWQNSDYGRELKKRYSEDSNITLLEPIYDIEKLKFIREHAVGYIHGHSAGGTNPSLVEMMFFNIPIFAYDCSFNRNTTEDQAIFFNNTDELEGAIDSMKHDQKELVSTRLLQVAKEKYRWSQIAKSYFQIL